MGFVVDHRGTRRVDSQHARMIIDAPPHVDIYPVDFPLEVDLQLH